MHTSLLYHLSTTNATTTILRLVSSPASASGQDHTTTSSAARHDTHRIGTDSPTDRRIDDVRLSCRRRLRRHHHHHHHHHHHRSRSLACPLAFVITTAPHRSILPLPLPLPLPSSLLPRPNRPWSLVLGPSTVFCHHTAVAPALALAHLISLPYSLSGCTAYLPSITA
ncbi:hypothetical protein IWZ03DRAFT_126234 [Phyllosticta citriasiana]|uniref:Uncharacterized protein n=1 Tax=Phyllosticta citriasiana TaxID=595635 RepID=A0ABR1KQZ3_9PEZI